MSKETGTKCDVVVEDCDTCILKARNCRNDAGATICSINKDADTFTCTYGCIPLNCPLIKNDIVIKLEKGVEVMSELQENK